MDNNDYGQYCNEDNKNTKNEKFSDRNPISIGGEKAHIKNKNKNKKTRKQGRYIK